MADSTTELKIVITGDNASAKKALEDTTNTVKKSKDASLDLGKELLKLGGAYMSVSTAVAFVKDSFMEFAKAEVSVIRLNNSLQSFGTYTKEGRDDLVKFSDEMQRLTGLEDDAVRSVMAYGMTLGISSENIKEATKMAEGLSKSLNMDLNTAMKLTGAYLEGNTQKMGRFLPALNELKTDSEKMAFVQERMNAGYKLSQELMDGSMGSVVRFQGSFGNFKESIGEYVSNAGKKFLDAMSFILDKFNGLGKEIKTLIFDLPKLTSGIAGFLVVFKDLKNIFDKDKKSAEDLTKSNEKLRDEIKKVAIQTKNTAKEKEDASKRSQDAMNEEAELDARLSEEKKERDKQVSEIKMQMIALSLQASMDAVFQEGVTIAKVLGSTIRAIAKELSQMMLMKSIAYFAVGDFVNGSGTAGASAIITGMGNKVASEIENNPIKMFADGGVISEPVYGTGISGQRYLFGEAGPERVVPMSNNNQYSDSLNIGVVNVYANDPESFRKQVMNMQRRTNTKMARR